MEVYNVATWAVNAGLIGCVQGSGRKESFELLLCIVMEGDARRPDWQRFLLWKFHIYPHFTHGYDPQLHYSNSKHLRESFLVTNGPGQDYLLPMIFYIATPCCLARFL
jgi:hypothetical protein